MPERKLIARGRHFSAYFLSALLLAACSQIAESINPAGWYNSGVDFFKDMDRNPENSKKKALEPVGENKTASPLVKDRDKLPPGTNKPFPTIASIDQQQDYHEARKRGALVADTEGRKYAPALARQGETAMRLAVAPPSEPKTSDFQAKPKAALAKPENTVGPSNAEQARVSKTAKSSLPSAKEQKKFQERLRKRLNIIRARAGQEPTELVAFNAAIASTDNFGTVVVNSGGVSTVYGNAIESKMVGVKESTSAFKRINNLKATQQTKLLLTSGAIKVATIHFRNGSAALSARDRQIIANALQLKKERGGHIHIIGHASSRTRSLDPIKHKMLNFNVSVDRADAVARELIRLGIKKEELVVDAISDTQPMYFEFMPTGEAGNRRAEIYLKS